MKVIVVGPGGQYHVRGPVIVDAKVGTDLEGVLYCAWCNERDCPHVQAVKAMERKGGKP